MIKLAPYQYIHVLDKNKSITRLEVGPQNFFPQDHEEITSGKQPIDYIVLKPFNYVIIENPVVLGKDNAPELDKNGQVKVNAGETQVRIFEEYRKPFPLFPLEVLASSGTAKIIKRYQAMQVRVIRDFIDESVERKAGDEYLIHGPASLYPRIELEDVCVIAPRIIKENCALKLKAKVKCKDIDGKNRDAGEEWLVSKPGFYLPAVTEEVVADVNGIILTETKALHLEAIRTFTDAYNKERKAGEQWMITREISPLHIQGIYEKIVKEVNFTIINQDQYCYVLDPFDDKANKNQIGQKELRIGPMAFFLKPGESIEGGIKDVYVLGEDDALLLEALEETDGKKSGEWWLVPGPTRYIPNVKVKVIELRHKLPLDEVEGVYVRNTRTGAARKVTGECYMLKETETYWEMKLPEEVEEIIKKQENKKREPYAIVSYKCPYNAAVQVYDFKKKSRRVEFGPKLIILDTDEQFTVSSLSGGTPKQPGRIQTIYISLGPSFSTDVIKVETSDHARLALRLSYNWKFDTSSVKADDVVKIFSVRDFIGDLCKDLASKVRGKVATMSFDVFHQQSARTIRIALFGLNNETQKINDTYRIDSNNLELFNVDIQLVEPEDEDTKEQLKNSVKQAIEITTRMQEQDARQKADSLEQAAKAQLDQAMLKSQTKYEEENQQLLVKKSLTESEKSTGMAYAEEKAHCEYEEIRAKALVEEAKYNSQARNLKESYMLQAQNSLETLEFNHTKKMKELEIEKAESLSKIESGKFKKIVDSIGRDTLVNVSKAGPKAQAEMLQSLGLKGYMLMDSKSPINLFSAAEGMMGLPPQKK